MVKKYKVTTLKDTRQTGKNKIGNMPKQIGKTKTTQYHYRVSAYKIYNEVPDELTEMNDPKLFKRWVNRFLVNPRNLPSLLKKNKNKNKEK